MDSQQSNYGGASVSYSWCAVFHSDRSSLPPAPQERDSRMWCLYRLLNRFGSLPNSGRLRRSDDAVHVSLSYFDAWRRWNDGTICCCAFHKCWICFRSAYMNVYPNPLVNGSISIPVNKAFTTNPTFILSNITGQEVMHGSLVGENGEYKISMSDLPAGTFVLKMIAGNQSSVSKIVKQ